MGLEYKRCHGVCFIFMALKDIINTINKEATDKVAEITKKTQLEAAQLTKEYHNKINEEKIRILEEKKNQAEKEKEQARIKIEAETKGLFLKKKHKILSLVYGKAIDRLLSLDDDEYAELMIKLLKKCPETEAEIIIARGKEELIKQAIKSAGRSYGYAGRLTDGQGGFIFSAANLEIDNTLETLIKEAREKTEAEVSKLLF